MTIDYKALAAEVREMRLGHKVFGGTLEILETLLEGMAEEKPAAWMALAYGLPSQATTDEPTAIRWRKAGGDVVPLYTHPAPAAPQADPKREPLSDERIAEIQRAAYERAAQECESRATAPQGEDYLACYYACADAIRALGGQHD